MWGSNDDVFEIPFPRYNLDQLELLSSQEESLRGRPLTTSMSLHCLHGGFPPAGLSATSSLSVLTRDLDLSALVFCLRRGILEVELSSLGLSMEDVLLNC